MLINSNHFAYSDAFASISVPLSGKIFFTSVIITNPKNNKSITIPNMLIDSGAMNSQIDGTKYVTPLGLDIKSGAGGICKGVTETIPCYKHVLNIKIGGLATITNVPVYVTTKTPLFNNLGWNGALEKLQMMVQPTTLTLSELAQAALGNAQAYFRSRF